LVRIPKGRRNHFWGIRIVCISTVVGGPWGEVGGTIK